VNFLPELVFGFAICSLLAFSYGSQWVTKYWKRAKNPVSINPSDGREMDISGGQGKRTEDSIVARREFKWRMEETRAHSERRERQIKLGMQVSISLLILGGALYIIISPAYQGNDKHWAYGSAGTILGFWLKK
jgi:hypothetical protein